MKKVLFIISVVVASCITPETPIASSQDSTNVDSGLVIIKTDTTNIILKDTSKVK